VFLAVNLHSNCLQMKAVQHIRVAGLMLRPHSSLFKRVMVRLKLVVMFVYSERNGCTQGTGAALYEGPDITNVTALALV
jgi:hypothetical protein